MEDGAQRLGRSDEVIALFFLEQNCTHQNFSYINQEILIFVYFFITLLLCVHTHV